MRLRFWFYLLSAGLAGGCSDTSEPDTGALAVAISGLPVGVDPLVRVTGPDRFARTVTAPETINGLAAGTYTVTASSVEAGVVTYAPARPRQSVAVTAGELADAAVEYAATSGSLVVTIGGLPGGSAAAVTVTGPAGFHRELAETATLDGLAPGSYTVAAAPVNVGGSTYTPAVASQQAALTPATTVQAMVTYHPPAGTGFNLMIDGLYLTQAVQTFSGAVPLVAGRDAYLRVFARASEANAAAPSVRVRLYESGVLLQTFTLAGSRSTTPTTIDEGSLDASWNVAIPGDLIRPNLSVVAEIDPADELAETDEGDNTFPANGTPLALDVRPAAPLEIVLVPVKQGNTTASVTEANRNDFIDILRRVWPLASIDVRVHSVYTSTAGAVKSDDDEAWKDLLEEIRALQIADRSNRHFYGVVRTGYNAGIAGIGYVPGLAAVGWDYLPSGAGVLAHEVGHNWGRRHAPCNDAPDIDTQFPYAGGTIGVYGFDVLAGRLKPPSATDIMGYCGNQWVSDYSYRGVMTYRAAETSSQSIAAGAVQRCLLIWGRITGRGVVLNPAFELTTVPRLPTRAGPYRVEARDADGRVLFDLAFEGDSIADVTSGERHFAFAVPVSSAAAARLATIELAGEGRRTIRRARQPLAPRTPLTMARVRAARVNGEVDLRWDVAEHPMALVRDARTGRILSFARGGRAALATDADEVELVLSDGVRSYGTRVRVAR